jgi:hypothetical protein
MNPAVVTEMPMRLEPAGPDPFIADLPSGTEPGRTAPGAERSTPPTSARKRGAR